LNDEVNMMVTGMGALAVIGTGMFLAGLFWLSPWWFRVWLLAPFALLGLSVFIARKTPKDTWLTFFGLTLGSAMVLFVGLAVAQTYLLISASVGG
jgi:hypothetical protein